MKRALPLALSLAVLVPIGCSSSPPAVPSPAASASAPHTASAPTAASAPATSSAPPVATAPAAPPNAPCEKGGWKTCDDLAETWTSMEITKHDDEAKKAAAALQAGCDDHKVASACMGYALMLKYGHATGKRDNAGSKPYFDKLPALGDLNGFRSKDKTEAGEKALATAVAECEKGRARACGQVGWAAYNGYQREKDIKLAYGSYKKACELGAGSGCRWAGHFAVTYPDAGGTDGKDLLEKGCNDLKNGGACDELGNEEEKARNDVWKALPFYKKGCDHGNRTACAHAGKILVDKKKAAEGKPLLEKACEAEDEIACKALKAPK